MNIKHPIAPIALALLAAACGGKSSSGGTTPKAASLEMTESGLAPIRADTSVDGGTLQRLFPDTEVRPDPENADIQEVFKNNERLFYVVAAFASNPERGVFNVQVTSPKIPGPRGWVVGQPLASTAGLDMCECWADLRVCYQQGTHVAVAIDHDDCEGLPGLGAITGRPIARLIWNPKPWPETPAYDSEPSGDSEGFGGDDEDEEEMDE